MLALALGACARFCDVPLAFSPGQRLPGRAALRPWWLVALGTLLPSGASLPGRATAAEPQGAAWRAEVGSGTGTFPTIGAALSAVPPDTSGATISIRPGVYKERVVIPAGPRVALEASAPGGLTVVWETQRPYEAAVEASPGARAVLRGLQIRHAGKSVANNYAVYSQGADLTLEDCDISSTTGAGVAAEGGRLVLDRSLVHDCPRQGIVLLGPMLGGTLKASIRATAVKGNGNWNGDGDAVRGPFDGVLARDAVEAELIDTVVESSGNAGVAAVEEAEVRISGGAVRANKGPASFTKNGGEIITK